MAKGKIKEMNRDCTKGEHCHCHDKEGQTLCTSDLTICQHCHSPQEKQVQILHGKTGHNFGEECDICSRIYTESPYVQRYLRKQLLEERKLVLSEIEETLPNLFDVEHEDLASFYKDFYKGHWQLKQELRQKTLKRIEELEK